MSERKRKNDKETDDVFQQGIDEEPLRKKAMNEGLSSRKATLSKKEKFEVLKAQHRDHPNYDFACKIERSVPSRFHTCTHLKAWLNVAPKHQACFIDDGDTNNLVFRDGYLYAIGQRVKDVMRGFVCTFAVLSSDKFEACIEVSDKVPLSFRKDDQGWVYDDVKATLTYVASSTTNAVQKCYAYTALMSDKDTDGMNNSHSGPSYFGFYEGFGRLRAYWKDDLLQHHSVSAKQQNQEQHDDTDNSDDSSDEESQGEQQQHDADDKGDDEEEGMEQQPVLVFKSFFESSPVLRLYTADDGSVKILPDDIDECTFGPEMKDARFRPYTDEESGENVYVFEDPLYDCAWSCLQSISAIKNFIAYTNYNQRFLLLGPHGFSKTRTVNNVSRLLLILKNKLPHDANVDEYVFQKDCARVTLTVKELFMADDQGRPSTLTQCITKCHEQPNQWCVLDLVVVDEWSMSMLAQFAALLDKVEKSGDQIPKNLFVIGSANEDNWYDAPFTSEIRSFLERFIVLPDLEVFNDNFFDDSHIPMMMDMDFWERRYQENGRRHKGIYPDIPNFKQHRNDVWFGRAFSLIEKTFAEFKKGSPDENDECPKHSQIIFSMRTFAPFPVLRGGFTSKDWYYYVFKPKFISLLVQLAFVYQKYTYGKQKHLLEGNFNNLCQKIFTPDS